MDFNRKCSILWLLLNIIVYLECVFRLLQHFTWHSGFLVGFKFGLIFFLPCFMNGFDFFRICLIPNVRTLITFFGMGSVIFRSILFRANLTNALILVKQVYGLFIPTF